jgi:hypothetical protein
LSNGYKALRELLVKTDHDEGRNRKLKSSIARYQSQPKPSIQYREKHIQGRNPIPRVHYGAILRGIHAFVIRTRRLRMHPNAYKCLLLSSTSSRRLGSSKPNKPNKKRQFSDDRPSAALQIRTSSGS